MIRATLALVVVIVSGAALTLFSVYGVEFIEAEQSSFRTSLDDVALGAAYYALMVCGVLGSERYVYLSSNEVDAYGIFRGMRWSYLYRALIVSPMIFATVVTSIGKDANVVMCLVFAFQNGFFWESIFASRERPAATDRPPAPAERQ